MVLPYLRRMGELHFFFPSFLVAAFFKPLSGNLLSAMWRWDKSMQEAGEVHFVRAKRSEPQRGSG